MTKDRASAGLSVGKSWVSSLQDLRHGLGKLLNNTRTAAPLSQLPAAAACSNDSLHRGLRRRRRLRSVDLLRGFFVIMMVLNHFLFFWGNKAAQNTGLYCVIVIAIGWFIASSLLMIMGISQVLSSVDQELPEEHVFLKTITRSVFLFGMEFVTTWTAWGADYLGEWDILSLMGESTMVLYVCRSLPSWFILMLSSLIVFVTPLLRARFVDADMSWGGLERVPYISDHIYPAHLVLRSKEIEAGTFYSEECNEEGGQSKCKTVLQSYFLSGGFPIFPWLAFPLVGFVVGRRMVMRTSTSTGMVHLKGQAEQFHRDLLPLSVIGCTLIALGLGGALYSSRHLQEQAQERLLPFVHDHNESYDETVAVFEFDYSLVPYLYISPLLFDPVSTTMILVQLGCFLLVLCGAYYMYDDDGSDDASDDDEVHRLQNVQRSKHEKNGLDWGGNEKPPITKPVPLKDETSSFWQRIFLRSSRFALTIFFLHYILVGWPLKINYVITKELRFFGWMGIWMALFCGTLAVVFLECLIAIWDTRYHGAYSLHWLLERLTYNVMQTSSISHCRLASIRAMGTWKYNSLKKEKRG